MLGAGAFQFFGALQVDPLAIVPASALLSLAGLPYYNHGAGDYDNAATADCN